MKEELHYGVALFVPSIIIFVRNNIMSSKKPLTRGKIFRLVAVGLIVALLTVYIGIKLPFVQERITRTQQTTIDLAAEQANKGCPRMTDELTRLDSVTSQHGLIFAYYYTITKANVKHADTVYVRSVMTPQIISGLKTSDKMQALNDMDCTILVNYADSNGRRMLSIWVSQEEYKR